VSLNPVADAFLQACLDPGQMAAALASLASTAEADGAVLVHKRGDRQLLPMCTPSIRQFVTDYLGGDHPIDPRVDLVNPTLQENFRLDHDDFSDEVMRRDPFYQEFLRPRGVGWNACALLTRSLDGDTVYLAFKRRLQAGPFTQALLGRAAALLPLLRTAAAAGVNAQVMGGASSVFAAGGHRFIYRLHDHRHATLANSDMPDNPVLSLRDGTIHLPDPRNRANATRAIDRALAGFAPVAALLRDEQGGRWSMRVIPALRDGFAMETDERAWIVLSQLDLVEDGSADAFVPLGMDLFGLSRAEARIAYWIMRGDSVSTIARRLSLQAGTVRNQLKAVFNKVGVARQVELVALLSRI
jgi:DNA-binding CsgD family transcriptional regulator